MAELRMTLIEKLRNPAWERDPAAALNSQAPARLNVEQTIATMDDAANEIESLQESLNDALNPRR